MKSYVDKDHAKSVVTGMIVAGVCLSIAATVAVGTVFAVGWTKYFLLVYWVPVFFIVVFLVVVLSLLRKDMLARRDGTQKDS